MNKKRNRHTGHMNAYKAQVVNKGTPLVIGKTLYFERQMPRTAKLALDKTVEFTVTQRVRALKHDETIEE